MQACPRRLILYPAILLAMAACSSPEPKPQPAPVDEHDGRTREVDGEKHAATNAPAEAKVEASLAGPGSTATPAGPGGPDPTPRTSSAFDSNQWNTAVGAAPGAGGGADGRGRMRRATGFAKPGDEPSTESYAAITENGFFVADAAPLSTFAADVDTASYANVRRLLAAGTLPPKDAVRVEEIINAMDYREPEPRGNEPFAVSHEVGPCPWQEQHELLRVGLKTRAIDTDKVPPCNLVFLLDVSGSMRSANKLPLVKRAMGLLVDQLRPQDRIAIVTYASGVKVPLPTASGADQDRIHQVLTNLQSGGGTNGAGGIQKAYEIATLNMAGAGINRVILCTDGDFNFGIRDPDALEQFITARRDGGIFLTVLGVGGGNLKDDRLERLADTGNGVYAYLDDLAEARRVLVDQFGASMMTVAKDVKLQLEFDPKRVAGYRLIGYENRVMKASEFRDDGKDAGEIGAGHAMTALYEIVPHGVAVPGSEANVAPAITTGGETASSPLATLRLRYKPPLGDAAREKTFPVGGGGGKASRSQRLAGAAAAFGMLLRGSQHLGNFGWDDLAALLDDADLDAPGLRQVVDQARAMKQPTGG